MILLNVYLPDSLPLQPLLRHARSAFSEQGRMLALKLARHRGKVIQAFVLLQDDFLLRVV